MVAAKDLRIGNKILRNGKVETVNIINDAREEYYNDFLIGTTDGLSYSQNEFNSIPLTHEILMKCGFKKVYKSEYTFVFDCETNSKFGSRWNLVNRQFSISYENIPFYNIKYVHQLQNLYFVLTGEELNINL